jgi:integrase
MKSTTESGRDVPVSGQSAAKAPALYQGFDGLLGVLAYTFARIGSVVNLKVEDYYPSGKRFLLRFREKGGKEKELSVHHKLEELLDQYFGATGLAKEPDSPLFPAAIGTHLLF